MTTWKLMNPGTPKKHPRHPRHPDDPEFFCGGPLQNGHAPGIPSPISCSPAATRASIPPHPDMTPENLCGIRHEEQQNAAKVIGAQRFTSWTCRTATWSQALTSAATSSARSAGTSPTSSSPATRKTCSPCTASTIPTTAPADRSYWTLSSRRRQQGIFPRTACTGIPAAHAEGNLVLAHQPAQHHG
jgi:hypothetical protein